MKPEKLVIELEALVQGIGIEIRKEKGNFRSDTCLLDGKAYVVLNKMHPVDYQIGVLARILFEQQAFDNQFIKPVVRKELERLWKNSSYTKNRDLEVGLE
jgi:hypothetical protein